ncbi:MAG: radical SAM protein [Planctomycetes bacterium]|nr:radical SAM protein [Planctomycetota bacterium]
MRLTVDDHARDGAGLVHVYPVVSRRARGVSIGINLNPNRACNFRCVYCQVDGLVRGKAPEIDLDRLERELRGFLAEVLRGDFMETRVPEGSRRLNDLAFSGDGEPTSVEDFAAVVARVGSVMRDEDLVGRVKLVLITNGSFARREPVQRGLAAMRPLGGEVWFKLDSATDEGQRRINDWAGGAAAAWENLVAAAHACPTWVQTCVFRMDGAPPSRAERDAYLALLARAKREAVPLEGVLLYGLARASHQPEAPRLAPVDAAWMEAFADEMRALGYEVRVSP